MDEAEIPLVVHPGTSAAQSPGALISNRLVRLLAHYLGRGPTRARTMVQPNLAVVVFGDTLTRAEQTLIAAGQADAVRRLRQVIQHSMREEAVAAVEQITGRRVIGYLGDVDPDANVAALVFTFDPHAGGRVKVVELDHERSLAEPPGSGAGGSAVN